MASASSVCLGSTCVGSTVTFEGFDLFNASGNYIGFVDADSVVTDTPEADSALLLLAGAALAVVMRRWRKRV
jgi:hypothetical protein